MFISSEYGRLDVFFAQVKHGVGVDEIIDHIVHSWQHALGIEHSH